jgi:DNA polymerase-3 subunit delta'
LERPWRELNAHVDAQRVPHAILIHGPPGLGKRRLAEAFAHRLICKSPQSAPCGSCASCRLLAAGNHPDLIQVRPAEPGKGIAVDAIRHLIADLALKSNYDGYRVVIVAPANLMNTHSANALLKTLEEPSGGTVIVLLTELPSSLPATILSRCLKLAVTPPDWAAAQRWLESETPGCAAAVLLALAGGLPLKAKELAATDAAEKRKAVFADCAAILCGRDSPIAVAERWHGEAQDRIVEWLTSWTADLARLLAAGEDAPLQNPDLRRDLQTLRGRLHLERLFEFWDLLLRFRPSAAGQANRQLLLEEVLIRWSLMGRLP